MTSFIGVYDKVLSSGDCGFVVNEFGVSSGELINQRFSEAALNSHYILIQKNEMLREMSAGGGKVARGAFLIISKWDCNEKW